MYAQWLEFDARWRQERLQREAAQARLARLARRPAATPTHPIGARPLARFGR